MCTEQLRDRKQHDKINVYETNDISLGLPTGWTRDKGDNFYFSEHATIEVRINDLKFATLDSEIIDIDEFNETMAHAVKENQYYVLLEKKPFTSQYNITGIKSIYGYSSDNPSRISYYFVRKKELIEIKLKFRVWETKGVWKPLDKLISTTIKLQP